MDFNNVVTLVSDDLERVEKELLVNLDSHVPMVNTVASYVFESGGKRLRPVLLVLASHLCGYAGERTALLSGVVEYIHTATLLHDDVIDGAKYRRGRPSANFEFGTDVTILCGDFLYSRAFMNLVKDGNPTIQMILAVAARTMSEGEVFQLVKTADFDLQMEDYLKIINSKTAVLFSSCCEIGAVLGDRSEEDRAALREYGTLVGLAFQMFDDILDYMGDPAVTGKKLGTDLNEGKMTLPVILLRETATDAEKAKLEEIITGDTRNEQDLEWIIGLMNSYGIREKAEQFVDDYLSRAKSALERFDDNEYRSALLFLADYVVKREK